MRAGGLPEPAPQELVHELGVGLAARLLHYHADERAEHVLVAGPVAGDGLRIAGEHLIDDGLQRGAIVDLPQAPALDDRPGAVTRLQHLGEHLLADGAADGAVVDELHELGHAAPAHG